MARAQELPQSKDKSREHAGREEFRVLLTELRTELQKILETLRGDRTK